MKVKCIECGKEEEGSLDELTERGWSFLSIGRETDLDDKIDPDVCWCSECGSTEKVVNYYRDVLVGEAL